MWKWRGGQRGGWQLCSPRRTPCEDTQLRAHGLLVEPTQWPRSLLFSYKCWIIMFCKIETSLCVFWYLRPPKAQRSETLRCHREAVIGNDSYLPQSSVNLLVDEVKVNPSVKEQCLALNRAKAKALLHVPDACRGFACRSFVWECG